MKYSKILMFLFVSFARLSYAADFKLSPSDPVEDVKYFLLQVKNDMELKILMWDSKVTPVMLR